MNRAVLIHGTNTTSTYNMHCGVAVLVNCPSICVSPISFHKSWSLYDHDEPKSSPITITHIWQHHPQSSPNHPQLLSFHKSPNHPQSLADNLWLSDLQSAPQHWSPRGFSAEWCSHCRPRWCCGFKHLGVQLVILMGNGITVMIQYNTQIGI